MTNDVAKLADELLPCPFCGEAAEMRESENCHDTWLVRCTSCQCKTVTSYTKYEPTVTWNARAYPAAQAHGDAAAIAEPLGLYSIHVAWSDEDKAFIATIPELPGCMTDASSRIEAIKELFDAKAAWIEACRKAGNPIPQPQRFAAAQAHGDVREGSNALLPRILTGEMACILEDCDGPENQKPAAVKALIEMYRPMWDKLCALSQPPAATGDPDFAVTAEQARTAAQKVLDDAQVTPEQLQQVYRVPAATGGERERIARLLAKEIPHLRRVDGGPGKRAGEIADAILVLFGGA